MRKKLIALLCVVCLCMTNVMPVFATGTELDTITTPMINSITLGTDLEELVDPEAFAVILNISAPEGMEITAIDAEYSRYQNDELVGEKIVSLHPEDTIPGVEGKNYELTVNVEEYDRSGVYILEKITLWNDADTKFDFVRCGDEMISENSSVVYEGEVDFEVSPKENEDDIAPVLTSFSLMEDDLGDAIYTDTPLYFELGFYDEGGSGLESVTAAFENLETGEEILFSGNVDESGTIGEEITLEAAGDTRVPGTYRLKDIQMDDYSGNTAPYFFEYEEDCIKIYLYGEEVTELAISGYEFTVEEGESVEEPEPSSWIDVEKIIVNTVDISVPGTVEFLIYMGEGSSELRSVGLYFEDVNEPRNNVYGAEDEDAFTYDEEKGCYVYRLSFGEDVLAGTYRVQNATFMTETDYFEYVYQSDEEHIELCDAGFVDTFPPVEMVVESSTCTDTDFDAPELKDIQFVSNSVMAGEDLEIKIKLEEPGLGYGLFTFRDEKDNIFYVYTDTIEENKDGTYTCICPVSKWQRAGTYTLYNVNLYDDSVHSNSVDYWYEGGNKFMKGEDGPVITVTGTDYSLTIKQLDGYVFSSANEEEIIAKVNAASKGNTLVISEQDVWGGYIIPVKALKTAKEKELTIIVTAPMGDSYITFEAKDLPEDIAKDLEVGISGMYEFIFDDVGENILDYPDNIYSNAIIILSEENLPVTVYLQGLSTLEDKVYNLFVENTEESLECVLTSLATDEEGFISFDVPAGSLNGDSTNVFVVSSKKGLDCEDEHQLVEEDGITFCEVCGSICEHVHELEKVEAVEATCTEDGCAEYYKCVAGDCGKLFADENASEEVSLESLVVEATGHKYPFPVLYTIDKMATCTEGAVLNVRCEACGELHPTLPQIETWSLGHKHDKKVVTKATTKANGKIEYVCSRSGCKDVDDTKTVTIYKPSKMTLSTTKYTYDGKTKKPSVTITDSKGKKISSSNYSVSYPSSKNVGKYSVKVTFKGNYSGTMSASFIINPKGTSMSSVSKASKAFTAKWKKQSTQVTGYQIQYSTSKKFSSAKTVTVSSYKTTSKKVTKLKAKTTYYVRVRTYKTVGKTKFYSGWSSPKSVKTK